MKKEAIAIALIVMTNALIQITGHTAARSAAEPDAKALSLLATALNLSNPANPKTARIHAEGIQLLNNQGRNPQEPIRTQRLSADWKVDFQNRRFLQRNAVYVGKDLMWCSESATTREMRYELFCHSNAFANYGPRQSDGSWFYRMDTTYPDPSWHLAHALERPESLHWEGESVIAGQREDVISYSDEFKAHHRLFLNARTHLLREVSTEAQLTRFQDGFMPRIVFENYSKNGPYWSPTKVTIVQASWTVITSDLQSIRRDFDGALAAADFAPPAGAIEFDQKNFEFHVSKVAPAAYFVENASFDYNSMFVVFTDHVLVVEAPSSDRDSTKVIAAIHETAPGKPIRYVVPTHWHEDHIGGLRAYIREGAKVVTTPGNLRFIEILMKKMRTTDPLIKSPDVEVIADKRRFTDGIVTLDLFNVASPHVDEMVVPFIASDGIVYVADGLTRDFGPWRRPTTEERVLLREFNQLGLNIRMVLPGHGPAASEKDLEQYFLQVGSLRAIARQR
ncbi:MAG TPA: MBL fold metallo-hydrolase [Pyrinomonadaceae bacterium]